MTAIEKIPNVRLKIFSPRSEQQEALVELTPLVRPKEFNCSGLQGIRNVSSDDPGPTLIREVRRT